MKKYGVRVLVQMSDFVEISANTEEEAIAIAKEKYYNGEIMNGLDNSDYYDGMEADIESEE